MIQQAKIFIFSTLFWPFSFLFMAILCIFTAVGRLFTHYRNIHFRIPAPGFAFLARLATFFQFKIHHHRDFDPEVLSLFCLNHTNILDAHTASATIPTPFCGLMNSWQVYIPFYGWLMKLSRGILIHSGNRWTIIQDITEQAKKRRQEGMSVLTFPEGHRTRDGKIREFKKGIFLIARDAGYPVVPVAVRGMYKVNRRKSYSFRPNPVDVWVGPQISLEGLSEHEVGLKAKEIRKMIVQFVESGKEPMIKEVAA